MINNYNHIFEMYELELNVSLFIQMHPISFKSDFEVKTMQSSTSNKFDLHGTKNT